MKLLLPLALIVAFLLVYALWGRDWLKSKSWAAPFFEWIEPWEIFLYKKSETILAGRALAVFGGLLTILTQLGSVDITPLMPFLPEKHQAIVQIVWNMLPLTITGVGWMIERLRKSTTLPLEVVAVPEKVIAENPKVAAAVDAAVTAKVEAVAVVKEEAA